METQGIRGAGGQKPRIAFLVDWLEDSYQDAVLKGAAKAAQERGVTLVVFPGGVIGSPHRNGHQRNHLFELVKPSEFDGVVLLSGTLGNFAGLAVLKELTQRFEGLPVCSIGVEVPGASSVLVDNAAGIRLSIEHLVDAHGHRKIVFIRGPESNAEAELRFSAYKEVLASRGIDFDESLVTPGDFQREGGVEAIRLLLDKRKLSLDQIDAIAGAADMMVIGARQELMRRRLPGGEQVALMGFDDIEQARWLTPPLSSVKQPLEEQGKEALRLVLQQSNVSNTTANVSNTTESVILNTELVARASCGCLNDGQHSLEYKADFTRLSLEAMLIQRRAILLAEMARAARGLYGAAGNAWAEAWLNALGAEFNGKTGAFLTMLHAQSTRVIGAEADVNIAHALLSLLRRDLSQAAGDNPLALKQLADLFDQARLLVSAAAERAQASLRLETGNWTRALTAAAVRFSGITDLRNLDDVSFEELPKLGVRSFYLARYLDPARQRAQLVAGYGTWGRLSEEIATHDYEANKLVPHKLLPAGQALNLIVEPLFHETQPLGFAIFEGGDCEGYAYEALRELLSTSLLNALRSSHTHQS